MVGIVLLLWIMTASVQRSRKRRIGVSIIHELLFRSKKGRNLHRSQPRIRQQTLSSSSILPVSLQTFLHHYAPRRGRTVLHLLRPAVSLRLRLRVGRMPSQSRRQMMKMRVLLMKMIEEVDGRIERENGRRRGRISGLMRNRGMDLLTSYCDDPLEGQMDSEASKMRSLLGLLCDCYPGVRR